MAGKRWTEEQDRFIRDHHLELTPSNMASELGRTVSAVHARVNVLGLTASGAEHRFLAGKSRSDEWIKALETKIGEPINSWLTRRYMDERATYRQITSELDINTRSLMKLMQRAKITPIDATTAVQRQAAADPDFSARLIRNIQSADARLNAAISRQVNWYERSNDDERTFLSALNGFGLFPIPQLAVDGYNLDFAFMDAMLDVELDSPWHNTKIRRPLDESRDDRLRELGWTILRLDNRLKMSFRLKRVSELLSALASTHP